MAGVLLVLMGTNPVSCTKKETKVTIKVKVKTSQGNPVVGALIRVDGKEVGVTGDKGSYERELKLESGKRKKQKHPSY